MIARVSLVLAAVALPVALAAQEAEPPTPASIVAEAAPEEWVEIAPEDLLVMQLAPDAAGRPRGVVIQLLPPPFSQGWVENIRTLAAAHWWDGTSVYRVVDNWVAQWGAGEDEEGRTVPLPEGVAAPNSAYEVSDDAPGGERLRAALQDAYEALSDALIRWRESGGDFPRVGPYADLEDFYEGWPIASNEDEPFTWPVHCYATVGVARDLSPDTGTGAELYAVIGHAPRQLDRNIAVVGRVIEGIEHLATLPRGTAEAGVYATKEEHTPIVSVRLASELPEAERPRFEYLASDSESFQRYVVVRANRSDAFYRVPAGGVDVCNVQVPIRRIAPGGG